MMKHALLCLLVGLVSCAMSGIASAFPASVVFPTLQATGSNFAQTAPQGPLSPAAPAATGTLYVSVSGNFGAAPLNVNAYLDGVIVGNLTQADKIGGSGPPGNVALYKAFTISNANLVTFLSNGSISFGFQVTQGSISTSTYTSVDAELAYSAVPEPTSMAILGVGACGLVGFVRRRRK